MHTLLHIATAGSVDDGKSTLIGRLLHDTKSVMEDHVAAAERAGKRYGEAAQLAMLTDGLRAEREQGITIDVAYRFFATPVRSFVVADTPGHVQYTRNMVTGASTSDVAVVLVDARNGMVEQSRRHAHIAALLGVRHLVVAVNKMDLVGWDEETFHIVAKQAITYVDAMAPNLAVTAIPVSALHGDNVVDRSTNASWYEGPTLLELLESVPTADDAPARGARLAVQWVIRPQTAEHHDYRGYAGRLVAGALHVGDDVVVLPSGTRSRVTGIESTRGPIAVGSPGQAITMQLADDLDVSRGDVIARADDALPMVGTELTADLCWMIEAPLAINARVWVKHGTRQVQAIVAGIEHVLDLAALDPAPASELRLNDIGRVHLRLANPIAADPYGVSRSTGCFIVIDPATHATAAAGMVRGIS